MFHAFAAAALAHLEYLRVTRQKSSKRASKYPLLLRLYLKRQAAFMVGIWSFSGKSSNPNNKARRKEERFPCYGSESCVGGSSSPVLGLKGKPVKKPLILRGEALKYHTRV